MSELNTATYLPPFKLSRTMKDFDLDYEKLSWLALKRSITGLINKINACNIRNIVVELVAENLVRRKGLFCRSILKAQIANPLFTEVFASLVAVINSKFPDLGSLLVGRLILQFKRAYKFNDKHQLVAALKFVAHLINQQVVHEVLCLELLVILLQNPTDASVEVAVGFVSDCGCRLLELSPKGLDCVFDRFRALLYHREIDKRVQFLIEKLFAVRKGEFQGYPAVRRELDLVEFEDQVTHEISLQDEIDPEVHLDFFKLDPDFIENEKRYDKLKKNILGDSDNDDGDCEECKKEEEQQMEIKDETETDLINLRRTIYLVLESCVDFEEAGHKLMRLGLNQGQEIELCIMILECCSQSKTYIRFYGLLAHRFCTISKSYEDSFEQCFVQQYSIVHRLETNNLRNAAVFFAHILAADAISWHVFSCIHLTEHDTTSSSRIFIKILFQELVEHLGIQKLNERLEDPVMQDSFQSLFPKDDPDNTKFSINFFTSIGFGGLTDNLRKYWRNLQQNLKLQKKLKSKNRFGSSDKESGSSESDSESSSGYHRHGRGKKHRRKC